MAVEWGYNAMNGPDKWAECFPEAAGNKQSPVNIRSVNAKTLNTRRKLEWKYITENTEKLTNTGHSWKVAVNGAGSELSGGPLDGKYILEQFHCHWGETDNQGSEHTVDGKQFAGELHLVHWNSTNYNSFAEAVKHSDGLCVLGVFIKSGRKHQELSKIVSLLSKIEFCGQSTKITEPLNPGLFLPENSGYYTYQGSLTTPPCSECVIWIIFKEAIEVSHEQLSTFRSLKSYAKEKTCPLDDSEGFVKNNFRPPLPLGNREILECKQ